MRYAMCVPAALMCPWNARGIGMGSSGPPSVETLKKRSVGDGAPVWRVLENTTRLPSGVQPVTPSGPGCQVRRTGSPPSIGTV